MSTHALNEQALIEAAQNEALLPDEASTIWRDEAGPSWIITALSFLGAQLVVLPFLGFLGALGWEFFFDVPGAFMAGAALIGGAAWVLRARPGMFVEQLCFSALLAGLALLVVGFKAELTNPALFVLIAIMLGVAMVIRVGWVQRVLGFMAGGAFMALVVPFELLDVIEPWMSWRYWSVWAYPMVLSTVALTLAWAWWAARERFWSGRAWAPALHAVADGAGVALLLAVVSGSTRHFWMLGLRSGSPAGSADVPGAGEASIFMLSWPALLQMALVAASAVWLARLWRLRQNASPREQGLLVLVYAVLLLACLVIPYVGMVAMVGTLALATGRRLMLGLALAALLAQLSGFYYALAWPLAHKAALLAGVGAALGLLLWAMRAPSASASRPGAAPLPHWPTLVLIAAGAMLSLGMVHFDVQKKEQVIAQGQKIYVPLMPRDPRSLMQGDYMALNFDLPLEVRQTLDGDALGMADHAQVVATLDERGVATVLRVARKGEALAAGERLLPVKRLKGDWTLITDAFYFPEGQGEPLALARFGEFRSLPDGRALLVGLADDKLRPITPAPRKRQP
ncbi:MAG: GDYXXLXY domain-containing protein [Pseudomonadota bacterium]|nr:GDYXXLXY domain-containing protein [Pseudomonadota bacterium]